MDWQPIETAPRDGTLILVCTRGYQRIRSMMTTFWSEASAKRFGAKFGWYHEGDGAITPTHWMPLPAPPKDHQP